MNYEPQNTEYDLRFTKRAKRILAGLALTGLVAGGVSQVASAESEAKPVPTQIEMANTGDTLWDMTDDVKNVEDRRDVIDWAEDNSPDLVDGSLDSGDEVVLPIDAKDIR